MTYEPSVIEPAVQSPNLRPQVHHPSRADQQVPHLYISAGEIVQIPSLFPDPWTRGFIANPAICKDVSFVLPYCAEVFWQRRSLTGPYMWGFVRHHGLEHSCSFSALEKGERQILVNFGLNRSLPELCDALELPTLLGVRQIQVSQPLHRPQFIWVPAFPNVTG